MRILQVVIDFILRTSAAAAILIVATETILLLEGRFGAGTPEHIVGLLLIALGTLWGMVKIIAGILDIKK